MKHDAAQGKEVIQELRYVDCGEGIERVGVS